ncbi:hypothetical protein CRYUN_Cryun02cG0072600 [Craigia yunnanensis]
MRKVRYGFEDHGVIVASASDAIWNNGAACGQLYQVNCLSRTNTGTSLPCQESVIREYVINT